MKKRSIFFGLLTTTLLICLIMTVFTVFAKSGYRLTLELFETSFVELSTKTSLSDSNDNRFGIKLVPTSDDGNAEFKDSFSGEFQLDYRFLSESSAVKNLRYDFEALDSDEKFSVEVKVSGLRRIYSVVVGNSKFTVSGDGVGVVITDDNSDVLSFDPNALTIKVGDNLLWCFSKYENGDYKTDFIFNGFSKYNVKLTFENADGENGILIYTVNGQSLDDDLLRIDYGKPAIYSPIKINGVLNHEFVIDEPICYDVMDGMIDAEKISYEIVRDNNEVIKQGNVSGDIVFTPDMVGDYSLRLSVTDNAGNKSQLNQNFKVFGVMPECEVIEYGTLTDNVIGLGGEVFIPRAKAVTKMSNNRDVITTVSILHEGVAEPDFNGVPANGFDYKFEKAGRWTIKYEAVGWSKEVIIEVSEERPCLEIDGELPVYTVVGQRYAIPQGKMTFNGQTKDAEINLLYPTMGKYAGRHFTFSEYGNYQVLYIAEFDGVTYTETRTIKCVTPTDKTFIGDAEIKNAEYSRDSEVYKGISITETRGKGGVTFAYPIDISNNTKDDIIIDMTAFPFVAGTMDFGEFEIRLTDIVDQSNYISIICTWNPWSVTSFTKIGHSGLGHIGVEDDELIRDDSDPYFGYQTNHTFTGAATDFNDNTFRLSIDYESKRVYLKGNDEGMPDDGAATDLSSLAFYSKPWKGFTDGKCILSIKANRFEGNKARYIVNKIGSYDLSKEVVDYSVPEISVDYAGNQSDEGVVVPRGIKNHPYPIFNVVSKNLFGENLDTDIHVYYNYGSKNCVEIDVVNGSFVPPLSGEYVIRYSAMDGLGNLSEEIVTVFVDNNAEKFKLSFANSEMTAFAGEKVDIQMPDFVENRGIAKIDKISITTPDNEVIVLDKEYFVPEKVGDYTVRIDGADYLGRIAVNKYILHVAANDKPVFSGDLTLLPVYSAGEKYLLPELFAKGYGAEKTENLDIAIKVVYKDGTTADIGEDRIFIPSGDCGDSFEVRYIANGDDENAISQSSRIVSYDYNELNLADYFVKDNTEITNSKLYNTIKVVDKTQPASVIFGRPLSVNKFNILMKVNPDANAFNGLKMTLYDSEDPSLNVVFDISKAEKNSLLSICGGKAAKMSGSFSDYTYLEIIYKNSTLQVFDNSSKPIMGVTTDANGNEFFGFPSGKVYMKIEFVGVDGDAAFELYNLNNQKMGNKKIDIGEPEIIINGDLGGVKDYNSVITLPTAGASDVLSPIDSISVTVRMPDGTFATATDGTLLKDADATKNYDLKFDSYGKWKIEYSAKDKADNVAKSGEFFIQVMRKEKFDFTVSESIQKTAKLNDEFVAPKAQMGKDGLKYDIIIISPHFEHTVVYDLEKDGEKAVNTYKFIFKGKYTVRYHVYDEYYVYVDEDYFIEVE